MSLYQYSDTNLEVLRLRSPEFMTKQRLGTISVAVENLRPHAPVEATVVPPSREVINYQVGLDSPSVIAEAEAIARNAAEVNELTVERLVDTAKNYALGEGNPLIDEALGNV